MPAAREAFALALSALREKAEREAAKPTEFCYWPMAITKEGKKLFTYECVPTIEKALEQFNFWENDYSFKIQEAWIESTGGKRIEVARRWVEVTGNGDK